MLNHSDGNDVGVYDYENIQREYRHGVVMARVETLIPDGQLQTFYFFFLSFFLSASLSPTQMMGDYYNTYIFFSPTQISNWGGTRGSKISGI